MRLIYWLLATTALVVSTFAQTPNGTRKAWNDTLWIDRDGTYQLVGDYIDTQNQSTLQFKDTTTLKAASFDSAGFVVNLKQLSSANTRGGGGFELRPAAEYTEDGIVCFASGNASYEWVRKEYKDQKILRPEWAGAVGNGTTDDYAAFSSIVSLGWTDQYWIEVDSKTYRLASALDLTNPLSSSSTLVGILMRGKGAHKTVLKFDSTITGPMIVLDGGTIAGSRVYNTHLEGFRITNNAVAKQDTGLYIKSATTGSIKGVACTNFRLGIRMNDVDNFAAERFAGAACIIGKRLESNVNGIAWIQCNDTGNDSVGVEILSNYGNVFVGGDRGNQPICFDGITTTNFTIIGGNHENSEQRFIRLGTNSNAQVYNARFLRGNSGTDLVAELNNTTHISFYNCVFNNFGATDSIITIVNSTCTVKFYGLNENENYYYWNEANSEKYAATYLNMVRTSAISGLDYGKLYLSQHDVDGTTQVDQLVMLGKVKGVNHRYYLFREFRYDLNTAPTAPVFVERVVHHWGRDLFATGVGDSTERTITINGGDPVDDIISITPLALRKTSGNTVTDMYATIKSYSEANGTITFIIWHKPNANLAYDPTAGSLDMELLYECVYQESSNW